jgi:hypothetical protein
MYVYSGKEVKAGPAGEGGLTAPVVKTLMKDLKNKGHAVHMDIVFP